VTPTSTDSGPRAAGKSFDRTVLVAALALGLIAAALFVAVLTQGPKLSAIHTEGSSRLLRIVANQPIASISPDDVVVSPSVPIGVDTAGSVISIRFVRGLPYNTVVTVDIAGIHGQAGGPESNFHYSFTTADTQLFYLDRSATEDRIMRTGLKDTEKTVAFAAPHIQEFAVIGDSFAVVVNNDDGTDSLGVLDAGTGLVETVQLPGAGTISELASTDSRSVLGLIFGSVSPVDGTFDQRLLTMDVSAGRTFIAAVGVGGLPLSVSDWKFIPGSSKAVVAGTDGLVSVVDGLTGMTTSVLGSYGTIGTLSTDGATMTVKKGDDWALIDLTSGAETRLATETIAGRHTYGSDAQELSDGRALEYLSVTNSSADAFVETIVIVDEGNVREVYTAASGTLIMGFSVSPNEQYLSIELNPDLANTEYDGPWANAQPRGIETYIVDMATGDVKRSFAGFDLVWD
jgi:hypothetical protein